MNAPTTPTATIELEASKCVIVLDADLPLGLIANTAAVLALSLGSRLPIVGPDNQDASGSLHSGLTKIPVPILRSDASSLKALREKATALEGVFVVDVTDAAQTTTNYQDYTQKLAGSTAESLRYLGLALFGPKKSVNKLVGALPLLP